MDTTNIKARLQVLEEENARLKLLLSKHGIPYETEKNNNISPISQPEVTVSNKKRLSLQEKVELFRSLLKELVCKFGWACM